MNEDSILIRAYPFKLYLHGRDKVGSYRLSQIDWDDVEYVRADVHSKPWIWVNDAYPPANTNILILIYSPKGVNEDEALYTDVVNSDFLVDQAQDYPKGYTIVAWMTAPDFPSLLAVKAQIDPE